MVAKTVRKKKTSETIKQELVNSIKEDDDLEQSDIDSIADTITDPIEPLRLIQPYEEI